MNIDLYQKIQWKILDIYEDYEPNDSERGIYIHTEAAVCDPIYKKFNKCKPFTLKMLFYLWWICQRQVFFKYQWYLLTPEDRRKWFEKVTADDHENDDDKNTD